MKQVLEMSIPEGRHLHVLGDTELSALDPARLIQTGAILYNVPDNIVGRNSNHLLDYCQALRQLGRFNPIGRRLRDKLRELKKENGNEDNA